jgi:hypothetical protein
MRRLLEWRVRLLVSLPFMVAAALLLAKDERIVAQPAAPSCVSDEDRVNIRRNLLQAVDDALHDHMKALFAGWLKDPAHQPQRASTGLQAAIVAYQRARQDALHWNPKSC